ncbi:hypothetical protein SMC26_01105 [Actinomadura fulvescens]|uniref:GH26 domain-containing protein n=1 Tax=Actinomadura fulvescens TaxID=46160 RepID=A0ABN3PQW0_9ACTN
MDIRFKISAVVATFVLVAGFLVYVQRSASDPYEPYRGPLASPGAADATPGTTLHIALNTTPGDYPRLRRLGYDLADVKPDDGGLAALPAGMRALLWVGNFQCDAFELPYDAFTAAVRKYSGHPKVYGWYLSDEPDPGTCPKIAGDIRRRADYVRRHAPGQVTFISLTDFPMKPVTPKKVNVDLVGLDPYPCKGAATARAECNVDAIDRMVRMADEAGIPRRVIVPVFQAFGTECSKGPRNYWLPTADQFRQLLRRWDRLVPRPPLDIAYSWGHQGEWACPTLADADGRNGRPDLQTLLKEHNAK